MRRPQRQGSTRQYDGDRRRCADRIGSALDGTILYTCRDCYVHLDDHRLETARQVGATRTISADDPDAAARILDLTDGKGVDPVIEAVGVPATFEFCQEITAPRGWSLPLPPQCCCGPWRPARSTRRN